MKIEVTFTPEPNDLKTISDGIKRYNQSFLSDEVVFENDTRFVVLAKDNSGKTIGGIRICGFWNYCILELVWIDENHRNDGIGSKLMSKAEKKASELGFEYIRTETTSFQALPFYKKLGYLVLGELPDYPKGYSTYCLYKKL